jgi:phage gpG-like protein
VALSVEITAFGDTIVRRDLLRFAANLEVPIAALEIAGVVLREAVEQQFDTEGRHGSGGWKPLAASTVTEKAKKGLAPEILQATGRLKDSLTRRFDPEHVERLSPDSLTFGSLVPYGIFHQTGTSRMPQRQPVALTEGDKVRLVKEMQAVLIGRSPLAGSRW